MPDEVKQPHGQHGGDTPLHLCPWCQAHVAEHDLAALIRHGRKWRVRYTAKEVAKK